MLYVKFSCENGYYGCDLEDVLEFDDDALEKEIDECIYNIARDNAESYEYTVSDSDADDIDEEDLASYYENIDFGWTYITKNEYDEYKKNNY